MLTEPNTRDKNTETTSRPYSLLAKKFYLIQKALHLKTSQALK